LPFADDEFDLVFECTMLGFVEEPAAAIAEMVRVTRPGGGVFVGELNRWSPWQMRRRVYGWLGRGSFAGVRFFSESQLVWMLRAAGLDDIATGKAVYFPPWNISPRWRQGLGRLCRLLCPWTGAFVGVCGRKPAMPK